MDVPSVVAKRGVLTAPAEVWQRAVRRAEVIGRLADGDAVGLCLAHVVTDKRAWLERLGVGEAVWPVSGKPSEIYVDNAAEFKSEDLRRGCEEHGIRVAWRPPGHAGAGLRPV
jgi:putative transposase